MPLVYVFMYVLLPITYPLSLFLDWLLGKEVGDFYDKAEFDALIEKHKLQDFVREDQARIMQGALRLDRKKVRDVMTRRDKMFTIKASARLDYTLMCEIFRQGYSRIPVMATGSGPGDEDRCEGLLFAKDLMLIVPANRTPVASVVAFFHRETVARVDADKPLDEVLKQLLGSRQHFAIVEEVDDSAEDRDPVVRIAGLVTMEDLIEEILQEEMVDEYDRVQDNNEGKPVAGRAVYADAELRRLGELGKGLNDLDSSTVRGVAAHLITNVQIFSSPPPGADGSDPPVECALSVDAVQALVRASRVYHYFRSRRDEQEEAPIPWLFRRGQSAHSMALVLEGQLEVLAGEDEIQAKKGVYDWVAEKALLRDEYRADFSARPITQRLRVLLVPRQAYKAAFRYAEFDDPTEAARTIAAAVRAAALAEGGDAAAEVIAADEGGGDRSRRSSAEALGLPGATADGGGDLDAAQSKGTSGSGAASAAFSGSRDTHGEEEEDNGIPISAMSSRGRQTGRLIGSGLLHAVRGPKPPAPPSGSSAALGRLESRGTTRAQRRVGIETEGSVGLMARYERTGPIEPGMPVRSTRRSAPASGQTGAAAAVLLAAAAGDTEAMAVAGGGGASESSGSAAAAASVNPEVAGSVDAKDVGMESV